VVLIICTSFSGCNAGAAKSWEAGATVIRANTIPPGSTDVRFSELSRSGAYGQSLQWSFVSTMEPRQYLNWLRERIRPGFRFHHQDADRQLILTGVKDGNAEALDVTVEASNQGSKVAIVLTSIPD
jgi:hypothetical protein